MSDNMKDAIEGINKAFEEFKSTNDARLAEIEKKGSADTLVEEKTKRINDAITEIQQKIAEVEKKANRPLAATDAANEDMEYRTAFADFVRTGVASAELKSMSVGSSADGGYAVPTIIDRAISEKLIQISPVRQLAKVISAASPNFNHLVNTHNTGMSGWVGETAARTATNTPQLVNVPIPNGEVYANAAVSQWMIDGDSVLDVEALISGELATEFARAEGAAFVSGNGTNKPSGLLNNTPTTSGDDSNLQYVAGGNASLLNSADSLINLVYALKSPYRANAKFAMNAATQATVRLLKDSQNRYLWQPNYAEGQPSTLLGAPVVEVPDMPAIAANAFPVLFGDFASGYLIMDRRNTITLRDPFTNKPYIMFYAAKRVGAQLVLPEAIKALKIAVS